nr:reverse transcriptase domain-containing protein [Tanacetum cinerariifolium]
MHEKSDFHWTTKAEEAFKQMKQLTAELPMLTEPMEKEDLIVYLAAAKETVSAVLMTEREAKQMPIYFVSRALSGLELNYTSMEKLVLALVHASKCLKRFDATNNEAEYEALIAGLRIAEQMGVKNLQANVDSRLVANQVNETYVAKDVDMIRYLEKEEKDVVDGKLARLLKSLKDLENIIEGQRFEKKDLSWTGLPEFVDDIVTDYNRPSPTVVSTSAEDENKDTSTSEDATSPNPPKPFVKFVKSKDNQPEKFVDDTVTDYSRPSPTVVSASAEDQNEDTSTFEDAASPNLPKPFVKFVKSKDNQPESLEFVLHKKPCFNCGDFFYLANNCRRRVQRETNRSQNYSYKSSTHRTAGHGPNGTHMRPPLRSSGPRPHEDSMRPSFRPAGHIPHGPSMNPRRPTMNVNNPYRAPWVPIINRFVPLVNRKFSTGRRNFPTANRKFSTASRKFTTGSTKNHTADMGRKGKAGSSQNNIDDKGYWDSG